MSRSIHARNLSPCDLPTRPIFFTERLESRRLLSAGQPDPTFGTAGFALGELFPGGSASAAALQADGKIIAAGTTDQFDIGSPEFALARFNSNGSLDRSFGVNGRVVTNIGGANQGILAVAVQKDGKIVAAGFSGNNFALARYLSTGKIDTTFGTNGIETLSFSGMAQINAIAIQSDGKIDVAGSAANTLGSERFALARFTTAGKLDTSFGTNGVTATNFPNTGGEADALVIQPNGDLVVGGGSDSGDGDPTFTLARYDSHGKLDHAFGSQGIEIDSSIGTGQFNSLALKSNGQIIAGGATFDGAVVVARFQSGGTIDSSFGSGGVATIPLNAEILQFATVLIQKSGDIVTVSTETNFAGPDTLSDIELTRFTPGGLPDNSFGSQGVEQTELPGEGSALAAVLQPNDRIVVAGNSLNGDTGGDFAFARYTLGGQLDSSFGFEGVVQQPNGITGSIDSTIVQSDGKIIVAGAELAPGNGPTEAALARYNTDGSLDTSFGVDGRAFFKIGSSAEFYTLAIDANGNIVAGGEGTNALGVDVFALARFHPNGTPDMSFGTGGVTITSFNDPDYQAIAGIAIQTNGDIVAAGSTSTEVAVARYLPSGMLDHSFASNGKFLYSDNNTIAAAAAVTLQSNGKILVSGNFNNEFGILRLLPGGTLDSGFGTGGVVITDFSGAHLGGSGNAILIDGSGNILVGGAAALNDGFDGVGFALARYSNINGKLDPTFGVGGKVTLLLPDDFDDEIFSMALQKNGKIVVGGVGGNFTSGPIVQPAGARPFLFVPTFHAEVLRFSAKGLLDTGFGQSGVALGTDSGELNTVTSVIVQSNGDIVGAATDLFRLKGG